MSARRTGSAERIPHVNPAFGEKRSGRPPSAQLQTAVVHQHLAVGDVQPTDERQARLELAVRITDVAHQGDVLVKVDTQLKAIQRRARVGDLKTERSIRDAA